MGRSLRPKHGLDLQGLARVVIDYCDTVGVEKPILVGNSLGCPVIIEVAASFPDRVKSAVLVSPAGGPNNQPLGRALRQMAQDGYREPIGMLPIATRDYLRFGVLQSLSLFKAMTAYPTLENLHLLDVPTLVIAGARDPLVKFSNAFVLAALPHVSAVKVPGAHALNFSAPELVAELIHAHLTGQSLLDGALAGGVAEMVEVYRRAEPSTAGPNGSSPSTLTSITCRRCGRPTTRSRSRTRRRRSRAAPALMDDVLTADPIGQAGPVERLRQSLVDAGEDEPASSRIDG